MNTVQVNVNYSDANDNVDAYFYLNAILLEKIEVTTPPNKTVYRHGEAIDYTGMVITASYTNDATKVVTDLCTISPRSGKTFDDDSLGEIGYSEGQDEKSCNFSLTELSIRQLLISSLPTKTSYKLGEAIDYSGMIVKAVYSDNSEVDVTNLCSYSVSAGKPFNPDEDIIVEVSYDDVSAQLTLTSITMSLQILSSPAKTAYRTGESIDYSGLVVKAVFSDGTENIVTDNCTITPAAGKAFDPDTDTSVEVTYIEIRNGVSDTQTSTLIFTPVSLTGLSVTSNPTKTAYKYGEAIDYSGMVVTANYSDGSSENVISKCTIKPKAGKKFDPETDTYVEITFDDVNCTLTLTPVTLTSLQVTTNPTKTEYTVGDVIDYSGIVVTASYSDNSNEDVTSECTFSPAAGTAFSSETIVTITYSEGKDEHTCNLTLTEEKASPMKLVVDTMPTKTSYKKGEAVDYSGAVIKMVYEDGTRHTVTDYCEFSPANGSTVTGAETKVTVKCAPPATPYVFDQNNGYVDNGVWKYENPTNTYIDIYEVMAGHKYLLTLDGNVGSRFRAMFTTTDVSKASGNVSGTKIINTNNPATYANVEYTPSSKGYIVVAKDNVGKSGVKTYLYDANASSSERTATVEFTLTSAVLTSLSVSKPVKTRYRIGETLDYTGAIVTAIYSDGSIVNVTKDAVFSPAEGTTVTSSNPAEVITSPVSVSYEDHEASFDIIKGGVAIVSLSVTSPDKTLYHVGDTIDYTGCTVTAVYWDGTTKDVTSQAVFSPAAGDTVSRYDLDDDNNLVVSISYEEIDETLASSISIDDYDYDRASGYDSLYDADYYWFTHLYATVTSLDVSTGQTQTQTFSTDISEYCDYPAEMGFGDYIDRETGEGKDVSLKAAYPRAGEGYPVAYPTQRNGQLGFVLHLYHNLIDPFLTSYISYYGENDGYVKSRYAGETFVPFMTVYYGSEASYTFNLTVATLQRELSITPPTKTTYHYGETIDYSGLTAIASYSNGDTADVTSLVDYSPRQGTKITSSRTCYVWYETEEYAEGRFEATVITLSDIEVTPPTKTSYHSGEAIDYSGATVTAKYSDGSPEDVTSSAIFNPAAGTVITEDTSVNVSYTNAWEETATGEFSLKIESEV